eukprot:g7502.t1
MSTLDCCKILKPNGFAVWEGIQRLLDPEIKAMGVQNAYFPLLIPVSFLSKEATHVDGFAKEGLVTGRARWSFDLQPATFLPLITYLAV